MHFEHRLFTPKVRPVALTERGGGFGML